ncbi:IQ-DOMAIN 14-like protein [Tanacetum coccineum]|uniref:IQ-DOMAIN 14-like protein n=1 Tax=Tanacetum coccineum TaxID=301880 RepID=A0ABQ5FW31_9ASTR
MKDPSQRVTVENDSTRMRSCMSASEKEQNNHAIGIAETAVADAADVVRLTSDSRGTLFSGREKWAATKIHQYIRGHVLLGLAATFYCVWLMQFVSLYNNPGLARRALRALRGLVKFQALVKGIVVRKRVAATLYSMQALLRAQLVFTSQRDYRSFKIIVFTENPSPKITVTWPTRNHLARNKGHVCVMNLMDEFDEVEDGSGWSRNVLLQYLFVVILLILTIVPICVMNSPTVSHSEVGYKGFIPMMLMDENLSENMICYDHEKWDTRFWNVLL